MRKIFVPVIILLFGIAIGGIAYHMYINMKHVDEILLYNTDKSVRTAEAVKIRLEATAEAVKIRLDEVNNAVLTNQTKIKADVAEIIEQQIQAVAKEMLTYEIYKKDHEELVSKLNALSEKK